MSVRKSNDTAQSTAAGKKAQKDGTAHPVRSGLAVFFGLFLPVALGCFFWLLQRWVFSLWAELDVNEVIYHLNAPLEGTGNGMIGQFISRCLVPALLIGAAVTAGMYFLRRRMQAGGKRWYKVLRTAVPLAGLALLAVSLLIFAKRMHVKQYIEDQLNVSTFIEDNYTDPGKTEITFPEKKRNLIFIYLESMEVSYADKASGGAFEQNVIPELTQLAEEAEDFSGSDTTLNGGRVLPGTTFTMGGIFGTTSGLPLKMEVAGFDEKFVEENNLFGNNDMYTQQHFFDSVVTMGDILKDAGYRQYFLLGSDVTFGGRKLYFSKHGDYTFYDYPYAKEVGWIPEDYGVFWGYEDQKLFANAKEVLTELAASDEPFNFTMLTVDTHFEDGYVCELCGHEFGDDQYANVFACSSRQITEFVDWCKQQDFYENTTIVLTGDHTTMDHDFCADVPEDYVRRTYTAYLNSAVETAEPDRRRDFSTLDIFPTTLASLGAEISGNRLGLGTNLFSDTDTLIEEFGADTVVTEVGRRSEFMQKLSDIDLFNEVYDNKGIIPQATLGVRSISEDGTVEFVLGEFVNLTEYIDHVDLKLYLGERTLENEKEVLIEKEVLQEVPMTEIGENTYQATVNIGDYKPEELCASATVTTRSGASYKVRDKMDLRSMITDMDLYLKMVSEALATGDYTLVITTKDEPTSGLTDSVKAGLKALGLEQDLTDQFRCSYLAVIGPDGVVTEQFSPDQPLEYEGVFPDGVKFWVASGGGNTKYNIGRVWVGTYQKTSLAAVNKRGFNMVLYDHANSRVADSVDFDTFELREDGTYRVLRED